MQMIVVDRIAQLFRQRAVELIGVHNGGENVLRAVFLLREAKNLLIEPAGVVIAAVFLEVRGVHIEDHLIEELWSARQCSCFLKTIGGEDGQDRLILQLFVVCSYFSLFPSYRVLSFLQAAGGQPISRLKTVMK